MDGQLALGLTQDLSKSGVEVEALGSEIELLLGYVPGVDLGGDLLGHHGPDTLHGRDRNVRFDQPFRPNSCGGCDRITAVPTM